ncbi:flagellin [Polynucleobacter sp. MWH-Berg-3C6]|uniref:flagellin N-terminal helical domain-containing protein n=1 Tax=Polynucleobacter sp. MWH-Berg-3C6 TaxID=1855882 RepID=UPI001C0AF8E6|nr:flagellin [Polynucleobacter sp. MWH-Berg-3C6]MBU3551663.1 flagellin FliC [Polynucleobacter sp. MWH-Berg-3C6]
MAAVLSTNMASLYAQKNLSTAQASLSASVQRLSSGTRINSAKDDAAGYGISESLKGTKNIVDQNIRNAKDGISYAQVAEGALDVVGKILQRSLTLATQATDGTLNEDQMKAIGNELVSLYEEVQNIKARTKFQGGVDSLSVFDASGNISVETGSGSGSATAVNPEMVHLDYAINLNECFYDFAVMLKDNGRFDNSVTDPADFVSEIQAQIAANATNRSDLGTAINSLEYAVDNMQTLSTNLADGISRIVDTDYAAETSNLTRTQILQQAATSMLAQANQMPNVILTLLK